MAGADWYHHLPWVLLGFRSAPKEDSAVSSAEMVYGSPLTLPGQFLDAPDPPNQEFIQDIRGRVNLKPPPLPNHHLTAPWPSFDPGDLCKAEHVFVRRDGHIPSLSLLYDGPYKGIRNLERSFCLQIGSSTNVISIDRLKPYRTRLRLFQLNLPGEDDHQTRELLYLKQSLSVILRREEFISLILRGY